MKEHTFEVERIAAFALRAADSDLSAAVEARLKLSILDTVGCAIGALGSESVRAIRGLVEEFGGGNQCTLIGGGRTAPDRAALVNGCLVRYLDFMDNYASRGEVCHPSDNIGALLAAAEYAGCSGRELLTAIAVSYQVQGRLMESLPTMRAGLNYTTPLAFSVAAGASRLLGLDHARAANALALAGVGSVSLAVIQAEPVSQWKGLASGEVSSRALHNTFLASREITGPLGVFDGPFGLNHLVHDHSTVDWSKEPLDLADRVSIKRYNAEFQSQTSVDAAVELHQRGVRAAEIDNIQVEVAKGAYDVLGGGSYGPKDECHTREQADHNLKYLVAVALLDGDIWPEQFASERINRPDVQALLQKVEVSSNFLYTRRTPKEMPVAITVKRTDGSEIGVEREDYPGFHSRPMAWDDVVAKFNRLTAPFLNNNLRDEIIGAVGALEDIKVADLTSLLAFCGG